MKYGFLAITLLAVVFLANSVVPYDVGLTTLFSKSSLAGSIISPALLPYVLENPLVSPESGGWGETFTYSVDVMAPKGGATVQLWERNQTGLPFRLLFSTFVEERFNDTVSFPYVFGSCGIYLSENAREFKWNASGDGWNASTAVIPYSLEPDDIRIEIVSGANVSIFRPGFDARNLTARIWDDDTNTPLGAGFEAYFHLTQDGHNFTATQIAFTNGTGHVRYLFNPDCSYEVGNQLWLTEFTQSQGSCYFSANSTHVSYNITAILEPALMKPRGPHPKDEPLEFEAVLGNECGEGVSGADLAFNASHEYAWVGCKAVEGVNATYACAVPPRELRPLPEGLYNVTVSASKAFYAPVEAFFENAFSLWRWPPFVSILSG
ncbi:hypothetical protein KJ765_03985 [Candidatus Micrarchaeota archaeon]|nr:hypothetical protein [Candidatus Micrarchaeota archaeon]